MQRDFKIGLLLGSVMAAIAIAWISTRPHAGFKSHTFSHSIESQDKPAESARFTNKLSGIPLPNAAAAIETGQVSSLSHKASQPSLPQAPAAQQPNQPNTQRFHIVRNGETLSDISFIYYGTTNKWQKIFNANRPHLKDADRVRPGTKLIIPP